MLYIMYIVVSIILLIIILFICYKNNYNLLVPIVGIVLAGCIYLNYSDSIKGGNWKCENMQVPYELKNRCVEVDIDNYKDKSECETFCLDKSEIRSTIENIIKFTYDKGIVFPVPKAFLESMETDNYSNKLSIFYEKTIDG